MFRLHLPPVKGASTLQVPNPESPNSSPRFTLNRASPTSLCKLELMDTQTAEKFLQQLVFSDKQKVKILKMKNTGLSFDISPPPINPLTSRSKPVLSSANKVGLFAPQKVANSPREFAKTKKRPFYAQPVLRENCRPLFHPKKAPPTKPRWNSSVHVPTAPEFTSWHRSGS